MDRRTEEWIKNKRCKLSEKPCKISEKPWDGCMEEWTDGWINEQRNQRMSRQNNGLTKEWIEKWMDRLIWKSV